MGSLSGSRDGRSKWWWSGGGLRGSRGLKGW